MTNEEVKGDLLNLARAMTTQANKDVGPRVNYHDSRLRDFVSMNPPTFLGFEVGGSPSIIS